MAAPSSEPNGSPPATGQSPDGEPTPSGSVRRARGRLIPDRLVEAGGQRVEELMIRPWPEQRARRTRWLAIVLLVLAPVIATVLTLWGVAAQETATVVDPVGTEGDSVLLVNATAVALDLQRNEMAFRLVFRPSGDLVDGTELTEDVSVVVNDISGSSLRTFDAGTVMEPATVVVGLSGSQLRYPFDSYDAELAVGAVSGNGSRQQPLPLDMEVGVALDQFSVSGTAQRQENAATVALTMHRRAAVIIWVLFFMALVWCIALAGASVAWFIVVYAKDPPIWTFTFFAAILFALPTLRAGLPGSPPYGSLVDWAGFYWGIAILAASLVALLTVWNVEARVKVRQQRSRDQARRVGQGAADR